MLGIFFIEYRILIWLFSFHTLIEFHCILISIDFIVYPLYVPLSMFLCFSLAAFKIFFLFWFWFCTARQDGPQWEFLMCPVGLRRSWICGLLPFSSFSSVIASPDSASSLDCQFLGGRDCPDSLFPWYRV